MHGKGIRVCAIGVHVTKKMKVFGHFLAGEEERDKLKRSILLVEYIILGTAQSGYYFTIYLQ